MKNLFSHNLGLKIVSVLLACLIWWLIRVEMQKSQGGMPPYYPRQPAFQNESNHTK